MQTAYAAESNVEESQKSSLLQDRRSGLRIRQRRPVKIFDAFTGRYFAGETVDLSTSGLKLGLPVSTPLFEGRLVSIHVGHSNGHGLTPHRAMRSARIVWLHRDPGLSRRLTCGLEFEPDDLASIEAA